MNLSYHNNRPVTLANYILDNQTTIRATSKVFNIPKSTVHHDISTKLKYINYPLYLRVQKLMLENFNVKHLHGGEATKKKYLALKKEININDENEYLNKI